MPALTCHFSNLSSVSILRPRRACLFTISCMEDSDSGDGGGASGRRRVDSGVGKRGQDDRGVGGRGLVRQSSGAILNACGPERSNIEAMNSSRVNALRASIHRHSDAISKLLLSSKESLEKDLQLSPLFEHVATRSLRHR